MQYKISPTLRKYLIIGVTSFSIILILFAFILSSFQHLFAPKAVINPYTTYINADAAFSIDYLRIWKIQATDLGNIKDILIADNLDSSKSVNSIKMHVTSYIEGQKPIDQQTDSIFERMQFDNEISANKLEKVQSATLNSKLNKSTLLFHVLINGKVRQQGKIIGMSDKKNNYFITEIYKDKDSKASDIISNMENSLKILKNEKS